VRTRYLAATFVAVLLTGCATKLIYQRLDFFLSWRLNDYVTLTEEQQPHYKKAFDDLWRWHREHELPRYAQDLRQVQAMLDRRESSPGEVAARIAQFQAHWEKLMDRTITSMCPVVKTLDDRQAQDILEGVDEKNEEFRKEYVEPSDAELRKKSIKRTEKWIKRWTGPLNDAQQESLKAWGESRRSIGPAWLAQRVQWRARLAEALKLRGTSPTCDEVRPLLVTPLDDVTPALAEDLAYNEALWNAMVARVIATLDERQRKRVREEIEELAGQLEQLSMMEPR
jgi:hypothetical protein